MCCLFMVGMTIGITNITVWFAEFFACVRRPMLGQIKSQHEDVRYRRRKKFSLPFDSINGHTLANTYTGTSRMCLFVRKIPCLSEYRSNSMQNRKKSILPQLRVFVLKWLRSRNQTGYTYRISCAFVKGMRKKRWNVKPKSPQSKNSSNHHAHQNAIWRLLLFGGYLWHSKCFSQYER